MSRFLKGRAASPGKAMGYAVFVQSREIPEPDSLVSPGSPDEEYRFYLDAKKKCLDQLDTLVERCKTERPDTLELIETERELLDDVSLDEDVAEQLKTAGTSARSAVARVLNGYVDEMNAISDEYASQRADEFQTLKHHLLLALSDMPLFQRAESNGNTDRPIVLVGEEIVPLDVANYSRCRIVGIVSRQGGRTSHVALLAQSRGIPAVFGIDPRQIPTKEETRIFVDGGRGRILVNPSGPLALSLVADVPEPDDRPVFAPGGERLFFRANVADRSGVEAALKYHADGIGLLRSEFLFLDETPDEQKQFERYRDIAKAISGPVVVRTLDVGGDKTIPAVPIPAESNPFLGLRGCRVYRKYPELFATQLRAVLRASAFGAIRVMFPMITSVRETKELLEQVQKAKEHLGSRNLAFNDNMPVGVMIETPAAVVIADKLAPLVDFFSLGTNDLTQYTLAADRNNAAVQDIYHAGHPAIFRMIRHVLRVASRYGREVEICGELAANPGVAKKLRAMGLRCWSMVPACIPGVKKSVSE